MLKKIFISCILIIALLSFVVSLLGGKNKIETTKKIASGGDSVAVINIAGPMFSGSGGVPRLFSEAEGANSGTIMKQLRKAGEDKSVKAVLLRINSPGGSVTAAEEIAREIARFKETSKKPIVATLGNSGASAAYYIAAPCDKIYANNSTLTGSIGVYMGGVNLQELYKKIGVTSVLIKSGEHKDIMSSTRPMTEEEKEIIQSMVDEMYLDFITVVSEGRKLPLEQVRSLADGRVYTGKQAHALGLVDEIGNYYDALDATGKLAGLKGTPKVKSYDKVADWSNIFLESFAQKIAQGLLSKWAPAEAESWNKG